jgi:alpha-ribazole phosphatase/probable phosphoglycerate mutase
LATTQVAPGQGSGSARPVRWQHMVVHVIYETHSRTIDNERGIATGWLPGELSADGRLFALELGRRWQETNLAAVYTSDLRRAVQTAEIAFADRGVPLITDTRLRECNYGALNGMPVARLETERARRIDTPYQNGQSYRQVVDQTRDFLRELAPGYQGQTILLIAHSANRWALQCLLDGQRLEELVDAPFVWKPGWRFTLPDNWC